MTDSSSLNHLARITNCLQTILDLEPELEKLELGQSLLDEFAVLKSFLEKVDRMSLSEEDVERIEKATASFLKELKGPLAQSEDEGNSRKSARLQ